MKKLVARALTCLGVAALLVGGGPALGQADGPAAKEKLARLPEEIAKQWRDAGASVGWIRPYGDFVREKAARAGDLPGFWFDNWRDGVVAKLPDPGTPFGLYLRGTLVTDAGLKELAGLKSLKWLDLSSTLVADAGLKELAGLKSLQRLNLGSTRVTDAGLKELAGLKSLQRLDLSSTRVTYAGVRELQKALPGCRIRRFE